jgi:hypothetical protein
MTGLFRYRAGALVLFAAVGFAQSPVLSAAPQVRAAVDSGKATPKQRGEMTRQFVTKWGMYVQRVYNVPVGTWAKRMVPNFVAADASNFRSALKRDTFEGAIAELSGAGHRVSDLQAIDRLARASLGQPSNAAKAVAAKFGDLNQDLVYTPILPCRILDTRSTAAGAIVANSTRSFKAINSADFTAQGGSATDCGTLGLSATAVAINLTAVTPSGAGFATAYPFGTAQPLAASVNYAAGAIVNNALIVQIPNPLTTSDFTVYTFAQSHYVADIVGYFAPPLATGLQCVDTANTTVSVASGATATAIAPACPTGYTRTATNCDTTSDTVGLLSMGNGSCRARSADIVTQQVSARATCCRVPGR